MDAAGGLGPLADSIRRLFRSLQPTLRGSLVLADATFTEIIHWNIGLKYLFQELGALEVSPLGTTKFNLPVNSIAKVTFLIGTYFEEHFSAIEDTVRLLSPDVLKAVHCVLALPEHVYSPVQGFASPFEYYHSILQKECGHNATVSLEHVPAVYAALPGGAFVLPASSRLFPPPAPPAEQLELDDLADSLKAQLLLFVQCLSTFLAAFNIREDVYVLGAVSDLIGRTLRSFPRKSTSATAAGLLSPERRASLIIIDRTMDMVAPMCHSENLLDRIFAAMPFLAPDSNDVRVPLPAGAPGANLYGCLAHPQSAPAQYMVDALATRRGREGFAALSRKLAELLAADNVSLSASQQQRPSAALTAAALAAVLKPFGEPASRAVRYHAPLQVAYGLLHALGGSQPWDELMAIEKMLTLSAGDNQQRLDSLLAQLLDLSIGGPSGRLPVRVVLKLVLFLYSLLGTDNLDDTHEQPIRRVLAGILLEHPQPIDVGWLGAVRTELQQYVASQKSGASSATAGSSTSGASSGDSFETNWEWKEDDTAPAEVKSGGAANEATHEKLYRAVDEKLAVVLETARKAGALRSEFTNLKELLKGAGAPVYVPLVQQLVSLLFDERLSEVADLRRQENSALGSLLKTGFSHFGFQAKKPKPRDHNILIIFVVGGITWMEIERIREVAGKYANYQIVIGGTCVTNSERAYDQLFQCD